MKKLLVLTMFALMSISMNAFALGQSDEPAGATVDKGNCNVQVVDGQVVAGDNKSGGTKTVTTDESESTEQ